MKKSFEQYDMSLVSIGHFSSNIGHILTAGRQHSAAVNFSTPVNLQQKGQEIMTFVDYNQN